MYAYGKHLGLAFQVVDDILDFTQSAEQLGKPQGQDLASGNLTAPALYALQVRRSLPASRAALRHCRASSGPATHVPVPAAARVPRLGQSSLRPSNPTTPAATPAG